MFHNIENLKFIALLRRYFIVLSYALACTNDPDEASSSLFDSNGSYFIFLLKVKYEL